VEEQAEMLSGLSSDLSSVFLEAADRTMLDYVVKLTQRPGDICRDDIDRLRAHDFDDRAIHDICAVTAYYAFVNRIADGLGVELEGTAE